MERTKITDLIIDGGKNGNEKRRKQGRENVHATQGKGQELKGRDKKKKGSEEKAWKDVNGN